MARGAVPYAPQQAKPGKIMTVKVRLSYPTMGHPLREPTRIPRQPRSLKRVAVVRSNSSPFLSGWS